MSDLPPTPPSGKKRYKMYCRNPADNPFRGRGLTEQTQTVDVDADTPPEQVERWAREAAEEAGYQFIRLEALT